MFIEQENYGINKTMYAELLSRNNETPLSAGVINKRKEILLGTLSLKERHSELKF
jgi:hypothetical protein